MNEGLPIKILAIDDDENDFLFVRSLLTGTDDGRFQLDWAQTYEAGLGLLCQNQHHLCLLDYRLGPRNGVELLETARANGSHTPVIVLTGMSQHEIYAAAMQAGAEDYLVKGRFDGPQLARAIQTVLTRKRAGETVSISEGRRRTAANPIREAIFQTNEFGHWTYLNPAWTEITGFPVAETLGTFFLDYVHYDDRQESRNVFLELVERKMDYCRFEARILTKDGRLRWMEVYAQRTINPDGGLLGTSGCLNDITERREAEEQVQKLAAFPRVNPNPVLEFTADGSLSYMNDAAMRLVETLGASGLQAILPANVLQVVRECLGTGQNRPRQEVVVNSRTLAWSFYPIVTSRVVHCYGTDVTEAVGMEAQFRQAQKLESIGQLAAGIAHDFNNILTVIQGYSDRLLVKCQGDPSVTAQLKQISDASRRAAGLTRQLLAFSRKQMIQTRSLDLTRVLQNHATMLARVLGEDVALETSFASDLPLIEADAGMIEQVVMNLAVNARDAMPRGGRLQILTSAAEVDAQHALKHVGSRPGKFVCLCVTDSGCGMDEATLGRIFEPFFSTKPVGKGSGLGLATIYGIVKQHKGWIEVESRPGTGTTFHIYLPVTTSSRGSPETTFIRRDIKGGKETILLVEDEKDLRELVREILRGYDYNVVEAANGFEALRMWDQLNGRVDLLLTDIVMPEGMNGKELAIHLRKRNPDLKVIYTSGYSAAITGTAEPNRRDGLFLAKPYRPPVLAQLVRECLDGTVG